MKIIVKAKPLAREQMVELLTQPTLGFDGKQSQVDVYKVSVKEAPIGGKSNQAIIKALAEYLIVGVLKHPYPFQLALQLLWFQDLLSGLEL